MLSYLGNVHIIAIRFGLPNGLGGEMIQLLKLIRIQRTTESARRSVTSRMRLVKNGRRYVRRDHSHPIIKIVLVAFVCRTKNVQSS